MTGFELYRLRGREMGAKIRQGNIRHVNMTRRQNRKSKRKGKKKDEAARN